MLDAITDIYGIKVGHFEEPRAKTGVTVVLCEGGAVGGVDARGFATGSRELAPLMPLHMVNQVHAIVLAGGSAFGLAATDGVMKYLEERGVGFPIRNLRIPIVAGAIIFDLLFGDSRIRPDAEMGYQACLAASSGPVAQGSVGAGCGATVGKLYGIEQAMKGGLGTASLQLPGGVMVGALAVVNAFGDVRDPDSGRLLAGARKGRESRELANTAERIKGMERPLTFSPENTTLGVIATNARLNKAEAGMVASMGHDGISRSIIPSHTPFDGDIVFALATGQAEGDMAKIGAAGAETLSKAIKRAIMEAEGLDILPAYKDL